MPAQGVETRFFPYGRAYLLALTLVGLSFLSPQLSTNAWMASLLDLFYGLLVASFFFDSFMHLELSRKFLYGVLSLGILLLSAALWQMSLQVFARRFF